MPFIADDPVIRKKELGDQSSSFVPDAAEEAFVPDEQAPSFSSVIAKGAGDAFKGISTGVAKGELDTLKGLGELGQGFLDNTAGRVVSWIEGKGFNKLEMDGSVSDLYRKNSDLNYKAQQILKPEGAWEQLGYSGEKILEFLVPAGSINKLAKTANAGAASKIALVGGKAVAQKLGGLAAEGLVQGLSAGAITAAQTGSINNNQVKTNALISAAFPWLVEGAKIAGTKIMESTIKPSYNDYKMGFDAKTIDEFNLGGDLKTSLGKTETRLQGLSRQLNSKLEGSGATVNIKDVVDKTVRDLNKKDFLVRNFSTNVPDAIADLKNEINGTAKYLAENGIETTPDAFPIVLAQDMKQAAGSKGAWAWGLPDKTKADAIDTVYTKFYQNMRVAIEESAEQAGVTGINGLNKSIGKLIPVKSALLRAVARTAKNNVFSLSDSMMLLGSVFDPKALLLYGANAASKSPEFAGYLLNAAESSIPKIVRGIVTSTKD